MKGMKMTAGSWNTDTIEGMEQTARGEADNECHIKIRGEWLTITATGKTFNYRWGKNLCSRETAAAILKTK